MKHKPIAVPTPPQPALPAGWGQVRLTAGLRPFLPVRRAPRPSAPDLVWGWLFVDPRLDQHDPWLKTLGLGPEARRQVCYVSVSADVVE